MSKYLASPGTNTPLKFLGDKFVNELDETECFQVENGVVVFDPSTAENQDLKTNLVAIIEKARTAGCLAAIEELSGARDYLLDKERMKYVDLLALSPSDTVLEIGASMGQHTRLIAKKCGHLEALEVVFEQAVFANLWCEQSGLNNVNVSAGGSNGLLPYKDNSFDVLIMNYVLEWCAGRSGLDPVAYHLNFLSECRRVLHPGGRLFLSTKNRHNIGLLLGGVDEHAGFRFGNALPRWIGALLGKRVKSGGRLIKSGELRGYLHSRKAIEQLFLNAGFIDLEPYLLLPDARRPKVVEDFDRAGLQRIKQQGYWKNCSKKEKILSALPYFLQKNIAPSHVYLIHKPRIP